MALKEVIGKVLAGGFCDVCCRSWLCTAPQKLGKTLSRRWRWRSRMLSRRLQLFQVEAPRLGSRDWRGGIFIRR